MQSRVPSILDGSTGRSQRLICCVEHETLGNPNASTGFHLSAPRWESTDSWVNMHFALPPRKTSQPPPYARASRNPSRHRHAQLRLLGYVVCGLLTLYLFFNSIPLSKSSVESIPAGTPPVVIVTVFDEQHMSKQYIEKIKANREDYSTRHGQTPTFRTVQPALLADNASFQVTRSS